MYFTSLVALLVIATALISAGERNAPAPSGTPLSLGADGRGASSALAEPAGPAPRDGLASAIAALHARPPEPEFDAAAEVAP